nr:HAMP domain-containing protein [Deltaproteobacteria bacterium]
MKIKRLTTRMVAATTFLVALTTITFSQIFLFQLKQALVEDFDQHGKSLTENLALNAELGLLLEDRDALTALGQNLLKEEMVEAIRIVNQNDQVMVDLQKSAASEQVLTAFSSPVRLTRQKSEFDVFVDQQSGKGELRELGSVQVVFSQERLISLTQKLQRRIYTFALIGLIPGAIVARYLSWITLKPVKRLVRASKEIAAGNWQMRVRESGDDEIGQLTRDFNVMADSLVKKRQELEESYRELARQERLAEVGKFSTIVAHEMKNPLGIIKGALNILAKKGGAPETKEIMLSYINEEVTRLNQLAEEFLDFARPPAPHKENFDLCETVHKVKSLFEVQTWDGKEVRVTVSSNAERALVNGDKNLLSQVLLNLLGNSVDACAVQACIEVSIQTSLDGTTLVVADNGIGVSEEDREQIFEPFFTRKEKGTGLGLAIVKNIIELHGGHIHCQQSGSGGACFRIWLPAHPLSGPAESSLNRSGTMI